LLLETQSTGPDGRDGMTPSNIISDRLIRLETPFMIRGNESALDADT
jgi:hypothetical protein